MIFTLYCPKFVSGSTNPLIHLDQATKCSYLVGLLLNELVSTDIPTSIIGLEFKALKPKQNIQLFSGNVLKLNNIYKNLCVLTTILLKFVPNGPIKNKPMLVKVKTWSRAGNKTFTMKQWWQNLLMHIMSH